MGRKRGAGFAAVLASAAIAATSAIGALADASPAPAPSALPARCTAGAHTLAAYGSRMYPDTGNGGYTSMHTDVYMVYDAASNRFLAGNHVVLGEQATRCLSSFTLDFERTSANLSAGPHMSVESVSVNGKPATFTFVAPTYPGDPNGPGDPNPQAHEASQNNPVGGPQRNPLPPACSPELLSEEPAQYDSLDGRQCPANKLLITPAAPIPAGARFAVAVYYTGRPGVHNDGDGTTEGWFGSGARGSFVATEPVGSEDWMPLNDHPTAKPTYDFFETVSAGKVAVANGVLRSVTQNPPSSEFAGGATTWHWHSAAPIASYLVQSSVGDYELSEHTTGGVLYYAAQDESLPPAQRFRNRTLIDTQPEVTAFESRWGGPFPFSSDGSLVGAPSVTFDEEMQSMISFTETVEPPLLWHENFHQWWGDNVGEGGYETTFFKEGLAEWMEFFVFPARKLEPAAFEAFLAKRFDGIYRARGSFWTLAPSQPFPWSLFYGAPTYLRPAAAYEALHQILGEPRFAQALGQIQQEYAGVSISETQLEAVFHAWLPNQSPECHTRLDRFFGEWFDTAYAPGGGPNRPQLTGPGLEGDDFYEGGCSPGGLENGGSRAGSPEASASPLQREAEAGGRPARSRVGVGQ